jgi:NTE family protein
VRHLEAVIATAIVGRDQTFLSQPCVAARTIEVDTSGAGVVDFRLSRQQKDDLLEHGHRAAEDFLASWDWENYLVNCRAR